MQHDMQQDLHAQVITCAQAKGADARVDGIYGNHAARGLLPLRRACDALCAWLRCVARLLKQPQVKLRSRRVLAILQEPPPAPAL